MRWVLRFLPAHSVIHSNTTQFLWSQHLCSSTSWKIILGRQEELSQLSRQTGVVSFSSEKPSGIGEMGMICVLRIRIKAKNLLKAGFLSCIRWDAETESFPWDCLWKDWILLELEMFELLLFLSCWLPAEWREQASPLLGAMQWLSTDCPLGSCCSHR